MATNLFRSNSLTIGLSPLGVATADFNGDGILDIVVANSNSSTVSIALGTGAGGFTLYRTLTVGATPTDVAVGDVNGDGRADIFVTNATGNRLATLVNNGVDFNAPTQRLVGANPGPLISADLNGDGRSDAIVGNCNGGSVSILLSAGGKLGAPTTIGLSGPLVGLSYGDVTGDGKGDIVATTRPTLTTTDVVVLAGGAGGTFGAPVTVSVAVPNVFAQALGDLNGDGKNDLVVTSSTVATVGVLLGNGAGGFGAPTQITIPSSTSSRLALADMNRDGKLDLVVTGGSSTAILTGKGDGTFNPPDLTFFDVSSVGGMALADLNGDAMPDIVASLTGNASVATLLNLGTTVTPTINQTKDFVSVKEAGGVNNQTPGQDGAGNVLANDGGTGLTVVGVAFTGGAGTVGQVGSALKGAFGTLTLQANGDFNYVVDQVATQSLGPSTAPSDVFTYRVKDTSGATASTTLLFSVAGANDAPIASFIPSAAFLANTFFSMPITVFTDPESGAISYSATLKGGGALPVGLSVNASNGTISGQASFGTFEIDMKGTDSGGLSASTQLNLQFVDSFFDISYAELGKAEGKSGATPFQFSIARRGNLSGAQNVNFAVTGSGLAPALGNDFVGGALPSGTVTFLANEAVKTLQIDVNGDSFRELNENFTVTLSPAIANTAVGIGASTVTIRDDDTPTPTNNAVLFGASTPGSGYELWVADGTASGTKMLADIRPGVRGSYPASFRGTNPAAFEHGALFNANDGQHGNELWFSDGTAGGTRMVFDFEPNAPNVGLNPRYMTTIGGKAFFSGFSAGGSGRELWITDGTAAGTRLVEDISPGLNSSGPRYMAALNGRVVFSAYDTVAGRELWISDGTMEGTERLRDIQPGSNGSAPQSLVTVGGFVLFSAVGPQGRELFRTDGTAAGTYQIADLLPGGSSSNPTNITRFGDRALFTASHPSAGAELWITNGTGAGTSLLSDINPGIAGASITDINVLGDKAIFNAVGQSASELWVTDGTVAGTEMLLSAPVSGAMGSAGMIGGKLVFTGFNTATGRELWVTDGTVAGTQLLKDIDTGIGSSSPGGFIEVNGKLGFSATDDVNGVSLWITDGTEAGTMSVGSHYPGINPGSHPITRARGTPGPRIATVNGRVIFAGADDTNTDGSADNRVLWISNGTPVGTSKLNSNQGVSVPLMLAPDAADGLSVYPMFTLGSKALFTGFDSTRGFELWATDGSAAGTAPISDLLPGTGGSYANNFGSLDSTHMLFSGRHQTAGYELWITDGTAAGTSMVKDINTTAGNNQRSDPANFRALNGKALFTAADGVHGDELWITDGTTAGTSLVKDINTDPGGSSFARALTVVNNTFVFFAQSSASSGQTLWRSDGTTAGTTKVHDVRYMEARRLGGAMAVASNKAFFASDDGVAGQELWVTNGTVGGTSLVTDLNPTGSSNPTEVIAFNGKIAFAATNGVSGRELWVTDGTAIGTTMVKDIVAGAGASNPDELTVLGTKLFFQADDGLNGRELWVSDGTAAGTSLLKDINPGAGSSTPNALASRNGMVFFQANDGQHGYELWATDGTAAGTRLVRDIETYQPAPRPDNGVAIQGPTFLSRLANLEIFATDATKAEGGSGSTPFTFTVTRSGTLTTAVSATFTASALQPDPAAATDFTSGKFATGTVSFANGETTKTITIDVQGDGVAEKDEQFLVTLSAPTAGGVIARGTAHGTILNDDTTISVSTLDSAKPEGDTGETIFTFLLTRAGNIGATHTVSGMIKSGTTNPASAADFGGAFSSGTETFAPGEVTKVVQIEVTGDTLVETNEQFQLVLTSATGGATIGTASATGIIQNDDASLAIARVKAAQVEGTGSAAAMQFTVTRSGATTGTSAATFTVKGAGTSLANAADFVGGAFPTGTVTFAPGETKQTITINVEGDTTVEADEDFSVVLSNGVGAKITTATATMTIQNDDSALSIVPATAIKAEGDAGTTALTFTVNRAGRLTGASKATFTVAGAGARPANAADFGGALPTGTVNFAAGESSQTVTINVSGDTAVEFDEGFDIALSSPTGAVITGSPASGTILDDDAIYGTTGSDTLPGTTGDDVFRIGGGLDVITGLAGTDLMQFLPEALGPAAANKTTLMDFDPSIGEKIDLSLIDAITATAGDDMFNFIGGAAFSGTPGELRAVQQGADVLVLGNVNTTLGAELNILVKAITGPNSGWFTL